MSLFQPFYTGVGYVLLILGIIIAVVGFVAGSVNQNMRKLRWLLVLVGIVVAFLGSATFKQIDAGHVGVQNSSAKSR